MKHLKVYPLLSILLMAGGAFVSCGTQPAEKQPADQFMAFSDESASFETIKSAVN